MGFSGNLFFCAGGSTILDAGLHNSYIWSNGSTDQTITVNSAGNYSVTITDGATPTTFGATVVEFRIQLPTITIGNLSFCNGSSTILDAGAGYTGYLWNNSSSNQTLSVISSGLYTVTVTDANTCTGSSSVQVVENQNPTPIITGNLSYCSGSSTVLDANGYVTYFWNERLPNQTITATYPGSYTVIVADVNACTGSSSV